MCVETFLGGLGTKQDRASKAAAREHSVNIIVAKEITKERTCLLGRKARRLPTDVAEEVLRTIFTLLLRINCVGKLRHWSTAYHIGTVWGPFLNSLTADRNFRQVTKMG